MPYSNDRPTQPPTSVITQMRRESTIYRRHERRLARNQARRAKAESMRQQSSSAKVNHIPKEANQDRTEWFTHRKTEETDDEMDMISDDATVFSVESHSSRGSSSSSSSRESNSHNTTTPLLVTAAAAASTAFGSTMRHSSSTPAGSSVLDNGLIYTSHGQLHGHKVVSPFERAAAAASSSSSSSNLHHWKRIPRSAAWPAAALTVAMIGKQAASKPWKNLH